jgi:addiction module HigA family antidote
MKTKHTVNAAAETLREILEQIPLAQKEIAEATGIPTAHLSGLKNGTRRFTPEYDLRLSRYFRQSEGFWLRLQLRADLRRTMAEKPSIKKVVKPIKLSRLAIA